MKMRSLLLLSGWLARAKDSHYTVPGHALADAARAMRTVRFHAKQWGVAGDSFAPGEWMLSPPIGVRSCWPGWLR